MVVQLPGRTSTRRFTEKMRGSLACFAAHRPDAWPLLFGKDDDDAEFCRLGDGLMVGWDRECRLVLTDTMSGSVDCGPFHDLDEICFFLAYLYA